MLKFWKRKPADDQPAPTEPDAEHAAVPEVVEPAATAAETDMPQPPKAAPATATADDPQDSWRARLGKGALARGVGQLFARNPPLDEDLLDELETQLLSADVGVEATTAMIDGLRVRIEKRDFADATALLAAVRSELIDLLTPVEQALDPSSAAPFVILVVGINGAGKTTTIGKLASRFQNQGRSVMLAAGDTFRAAAVEQLQTWGERNQVPVIAQGSGADSASVIFDAMQAARSRNIDVLLADTAGRLHTQSGLMDELTKIRRVLSRIDPDAPHEVLLVLDGTTGQNAISQMRQFQKAIGVSGVAVTKLDGTAKGGVLFALAREFGVPIRYIGLGEGIDDLRIFRARRFVDALIPERLGSDG